MSRQAEEKVSELGGVMIRHMDEIGRLRRALEAIRDLPPGSMGAYSKFAQAQRIAKDALARKE